VAAVLASAGRHEQHQPDEEDERDDGSEGASQSADVRMPTGREMGEVMLRALRESGAVPSESGVLYPDLNGEVFRAADLGNALVRVARHYTLHTWAQSILATSFGDTGACAGLMAVCMADRAMRRGYARGSHTLIVAASDEGNYGAISLSSYDYNYGTS
jgi:hypothetical protein